MKLDYIFITFDAILEFASGRFFQSAEFDQSERLCKVLSNTNKDWHNSSIKFQVSEETKGGFFFTSKIDKKRGILFDFVTFDGFTNKSNSDIITIFQKTIKFGVRYFEKHPPVSCERNLDENTAIVYPYPYVATHDVDKVCIDKNSSSQNRKEQDFLTVYYFGKKGDKRPETARLNKAVKYLSTGDFSITNEEEVVDDVQSLSVTQLDGTDCKISIENKLGFDKWLPFLTSTQRRFIERDVNGAERLEGAAGSGKTISMVLRCIYLLREARSKKEPLHIIFITHSKATKERIQMVFDGNINDSQSYQETLSEQPEQSILITTLQEWSGNHLGTNSISSNEYLDLDATTSKGLQLMYIEEAFGKIMDSQWNGFSTICSEVLKRFIEKQSCEYVVTMLQYEFSVIIKGRANGARRKYLEIERPKLSLPLETENDRKFIYSIYTAYQESLEQVGQYDTDDITISAIGHMDTPIWKRRSIKEGYDVCFIDESQLFNLNELSVFHYLCKPSKNNHIIYAIDRSQAIGEVGFNESDLQELTDDKKAESTSLKTIFRSSPDIINLAFNVLSANASLFCNFENPVDKCAFSFTREEEEKCVAPTYKMLGSDELMIKSVFEDADYYAKHYKVRKPDILIVATTDDLTQSVIKYASNINKPIIELQGRNDTKTVNQARIDNKYVIGGIDYIGGLEFDVVLILGVDKGRIPPEATDSCDSPHFIKYLAHNRLYVAITRAKYHVAFYGDVSHGISPSLESAMGIGLLENPV